MAKSLRILANLPKRNPVEDIRCRSLFEAQTLAEAKRLEGFDAKATQRKYGSRKSPSYEFTCFVYEKMK